jgi:flagellar basal body-associated protein FliL
MMKYCIVLIIGAAVGFVCFRGSSSVSVANPAVGKSAFASIPAVTAATQEISSNALKRPLDRTHEVLNQVRKNTADNAF